jgi:exopolysaccharide biosynthesis protein
MKKLFKNFTKYILITTLSFSTVAVSYKPVYALPNTLYDQKTVEKVTKGVTYELSHKLTDEGWLDVNVLRINLQDPNITVEPVKSNEIGLKETVQNLVNSNGAIAGVNSDFFGMAGTHSSSFGVAVDNGQVVVASDDKNQTSDDFATFFLDGNNNPFIGFLKTNFQFLNNGVENIAISSINKAGDAVYAMRFDKNGGANTKALDDRFQNLVKLVVQNGVISYISSKGQTVNVPNNGYLIILNEDEYNEKGSFFAVGQKAQFNLISSIDLDKVKTAISGGAKVLENGGMAENPGEVISGTSRQPRTALGITADGKELILMVVDGRSHSIGATQQELAELLLSYGVTNAMNFDGGGSSTMVAKTINDKVAEVKNTVSDGSQRKVINGLGIFNKSTVGAMKQLVVRTNQSNVFKDTAIEVNVFGFDDYYNKIDIPFEKVAVTTSDIGGRWEGNKFFPSIAGNVLITAQYGGFSETANFRSLNAAEIKANVESIGLEIGENIAIGLTGTDYEGFNLAVDATTAKYEVVPPTLGKVSKGVFTAASNGQGYIKCSVGEASRYIPVVINSKKKQINSFEKNSGVNVAFSAYPNTIIGSAGVVSEQVTDGASALKLSYTFAVTDGYTQAAYLDFVKPIAIEGSPTALEMSVNADNSNQWLRGRVVGADGKSYTVDFARTINWNGWSTVKATIPSGIQYPIKLDRVYVAALSNSDTNSHTLYIDNLKGVYNLPTGNIKLPQQSSYIDIKKIDLASTKIAESFDITILPSITVAEDKKPSNYAQIQQSVFENFKKNSSLGIFAADANVEASPGTIKYSSSYKVDQYANVGIIQMTAINGGLRNTDQNQWTVFENDINNLNKDHIIIVLDKNPLAFTDTKEKELFQSIVEKVYNQGKSVFIVSTGGATWATVEDGIRYINLGSLFNADGTANANYRMLRLRVTGKQIQYDYK